MAGRLSPFPPSWRDLMSTEAFRRSTAHVVGGSARAARPAHGDYRAFGRLIGGKSPLRSGRGPWVPDHSEHTCCSWGWLRLRILSTETTTR